MDRGLLARATSADDGPTPGYLYGEIAKMTRASFDVCAKVEEYLAKRCSNKNANVKLKALVVIRHVAEKGAPQFKQQMVRRLPVIKDCQQFSGPPDPLRGDEPYRKVRVAAKDAIEALTSDDYEQPAQSMQGFSGGGDAYNDGPANYPPQRGRMEGFGNSIPEAEPTTYMAKAQRMASQMAEKAASRLQKSDSGYRGGDQRRSAEFSSHRSMPGVGNPRFGDARNAPPSWKERVQEGARQAADSVQKMRFGTSSTESFDPSYNYASNRGANAYGGGTFQAPSSSSSQDWGDRRRGNVGGGWGNTNTPQPPPRQSAPSYEAHTTTQSSAAGRAGGAATDGEYERHLVKDLCGAGGTRAAPPADKLQAFVDAAATLDADAVGPALLEELDDAKPWQSRAKACAVVEALCRADGCEHHLGYFSEVADDLQGLEAASNLALRKQARRMLSALGVAGDAPAVGAAARAAASVDGGRPARRLRGAGRGGAVAPRRVRRRARGGGARVGAAVAARRVRRRRARAARRAAGAAAGAARAGGPLRQPQRQGDVAAAAPKNGGGAAVAARRLQRGPRGRLDGRLRRLPRDGGRRRRRLRERRARARGARGAAAAAPGNTKIAGLAGRRPLRGAHGPPAHARGQVPRGDGRPDGAGLRRPTIAAAAVAGAAAVPAAAGVAAAAVAAAAVAPAAADGRRPAVVHGRAAHDARPRGGDPAGRAGRVAVGLRLHGRAGAGGRLVRLRVGHDRREVPGGGRT